MKYDKVQETLDLLKEIAKGSGLMPVDTDKSKLGYYEVTFKNEKVIHVHPALVDSMLEGYMRTNMNSFNTDLLLGHNDETGESIALNARDILSIVLIKD